jgi:2-chlorobenzoate 1,2-dioxygenase
VHAGIVHLSSHQAAEAVGKKYFGGDLAKQPRWLVMLQMQVPPDPESFWTEMHSHNFKYGHAYFRGYQNPRGDDPVTVAYERLLKQRHGEEKAEKFLARSFHHTVIYPCLSIQSQFQQLRVVKPLSVDRTLMEIWHFKLKGAPPEFFTRNLSLSNMLNSPSTIISSDDYETWYRCHEGLKAMGNDWVSLHRNAGQDIVDDSGMHSSTGTSEAWQRNQFAAWREYMSAEG